MQFIDFVGKYSNYTMNIDSQDSDLTSMLIITTDESGQQKPITSIPTIYPNDYDFDLETGFKAKSAASRSFIRPPKTLSQEHRNKSVPHSLQVCLKLNTRLRTNKRKEINFFSFFGVLLLIKSTIAFSFCIVYGKRKKYEEHDSTFCT